MTTTDATFEQRALRLVRDLLDMEASARATALAGIEPELRARVETLLSRVADDDLRDAPLDQRVGPYQLLERIGQGGMGEVFRARRVDGAFEKDVAIKRIWAGHASLAARFVRERQVLARLQHPHIAQLLDGGIDDAGKPWLAMELVGGDDIATWCDAQGASLARRVELLAQACDAVDHAHRQLIVHRDIKPSNILVDGEGHAKLLDFGIARLLDEDDGERTQTHAMTPAWAAPEQQQGDPVTTASDVYQLGLVARALLSGLPRAGSAARMSAEVARLRRESPATVDALARGRGTTPEGLQRQLRGDLDSIIALATARDPDERYPSARALADDLRGWLRGNPVQARRDERGYRLRRAARRWWPALAAGVAGLALLGFHFHSLSNALGHTERERARAVAAERQAAVDRAQAERERDAAQAVSGYLVTLFRAASPAATRGGEISARELLRKGETQLEEAVAGAQSPPAVGAIWQALAQVHNELGEYPRALELQQRAVAQLRRDGNPQALAEALRVQAWAHYFQDDPRHFLEHAQASHRLLVSAGLADGPTFAKTSSALGLAYFVNGQPDRAWPQFDASVALGRKLGPNATDAHLKNLLNAIAAANEAGEHARAYAWLAEAEATAMQLRQRNTDSELMVGAQLGVTLRRLDRLPEARARLEPMVVRARQHYGLGHPRLAFVQLELAALDLAQDRPEDALVRIDELERLAANAFSAGHSTHADLAGLRGVALLMLGRTDQARASLARARAVRGAAYTAEVRGDLEQVAMARSTCDAGLQDKVAQFTDSRRAEPWQQRLGQRWLGECARAHSRG
ncbi:protein kinase [Thermomonas sp.]|uniref:serine/threonine-protein kinase n=1 Tax=Thermomonas sp. TaxID=1971895 RepID=UPI0035B42303